MQMNRQQLYTGVGLLVVLLLVLWAYFGSITADKALVQELQRRVKDLKGQEAALRHAQGIPSEEDGLIGFYAKRPNFEIESRGLTRVEIWAVPTGTGITAKDHYRIGIAKKHSEINRLQFWLLAIPKDPLSVTEIYIKGFDYNNKEVERMSLAATGASEIHQVLWD